MADRWGRIPTILTWSCVSLALSFSIGWLIAAPIALLVALACLYNFAGIADSSTHSTVLAESVPPHYLGVAYAVRSVVGFGAGVVSPVVFGWALDASGGSLGHRLGDARHRRHARAGGDLAAAQDSFMIAVALAWARLRPLAAAREESPLVLQQQLGEPGGAVPALAAARLEVGLELVDERGHRQARADFPRLVEADAHVLAHPLGGEAEAFGLQLVHLLPAVLHLPGLRRALGDDADHFLDVELVALREARPPRPAPARCRRCRSG